MTKGELRTIIREVLQEELSKETPLKEAVEGPTYVIKCWDTPDKNGASLIDTSRNGEKYPDFDDVIKALDTKYSGKGAYEILWIPTGQKSK